MKRLPFFGAGLVLVTAWICSGFVEPAAAQNPGTVKAWGDNTWGQLGNGTTTSSGTPVTVTGLTSAIGVAAGAAHSMALKSDGTVWAWGDNTYGQLGRGNHTAATTPVQVLFLSGVISIK